jgi:hypothetical protein
MNMKVAVLLALTLLAFGSAVVATAFNVSAPKLSSVSFGFVESDDPPAQPNGDPIGDGEFPH